jgi:hypothetical protein
MKRHIKTAVFATVLVGSFILYQNCSPAKFTPDAASSVTGLVDENGNPIGAFVNMAPGRISFNTVFLYNTVKPSLSDQDSLKAMAAAGGGSFIIADSKQTLSISDVIQVPHDICQ